MIPEHQRIAKACVTAPPLPLEGLTGSGTFGLLCNIVFVHIFSLLGQLTFSGYLIK